MKIKITIIFLFLFSCIFLYGQKHLRKVGDSFFATMHTEHAKDLLKKHPKEIQIIQSNGTLSAVRLTAAGAEELHHKILSHGPGYLYQKSKEKAIWSITHKKGRTMDRKSLMNYSIDQSSVIQQCLPLIQSKNIVNQISELESYGTRFHTKTSARQAMIDLKTKWENMANGRSDISVRLFEHQNSNMPSVILTITGTQYPDEYVIIGGHGDSTSNNNNIAPGADDNASGIATITEATRVLISANFRPKRTIEVMAYAAEEIGLVGSQEIAESYKENDVNVLGYVQFDMTNYNGSTKDIYFMNDTYTNNNLNNYLMSLLDYYHASNSNDPITYATDKCNYGCSDHFSWSQQGYEVSFPFEATFSGSNPNIHTTKDTSDKFFDQTASHATKFTKLAIEFLVEVAKGTTGNVDCEATIPQNLKINQIGDLEVKLSWDAISAASYIINYRKKESNTWNTRTSNTPSIELNGLDAETEYELKIKSICPNGEESDFTNTVSFTTLELILEYCESKSNNSKDEYIGNVTIGTIDNDSDASNYSDFTSISTELMMGENINFSVTPVWPGSLYNETLSIWIDYNIDGDFDDQNELVYSKDADKTSPITSSFIIPKSAKKGATRMRISLKYETKATSCESFNYGEVEDYTIFITTNTNDNTPPVITLLGESEITVEKGATFTDPGATALDETDGDITSSIIVTGDVNTDNIGKYSLSYDVSDSSGNNAETVKRLVNVIERSNEKVIISEGYFETGWDSWKDGGSDSNRYEGTRSPEGNFSIRLRDNSKSSKMTLENLNLDSYKEIEISFSFYMYSMKKGQSLQVEYNDGNNWIMLANYKRSSTYKNKKVYNEIITISDNLNDNAKIRFVNQGENNSDQVYIDQVVISGLKQNLKVEESNKSISLEDIKKSNVEKRELMVFPNPVRTQQLNLNQAFINVNYEIYNLSNIKVKEGQLNGKQISIVSLNKGVYVLKIKQGEKIKTTKFIKQ